MKKLSFIIPLAAAVILCGCGTGSGSSSTSSSNSTDTQTSADTQAFTNTVSASDERLSVEKAKNIALEYAGITEADFRDYDQDTDYGKYEFEFTANGVEYEVDVDYTTGEVLRYRTERD